LNDLSTPLREITAVRQQFPGTDKWIYFETSARGLLPIGARDAVMRYLDGRIYEGGERSSMLDVLERVREKFARLIGGQPEEIAIVKNVSEGINAIVTSIPWKAGDNAVLCADIEHPNSLYSLYNMRDRHGIEVRAVPSTQISRLRSKRSHEISMPRPGSSSRQQLLIRPAPAAISMRSPSCARIAM